MADRDGCATCGHPDWQHFKSTGPCGIDICACEKFSVRVDPSPPSDAGWDDSDDQGNPGAV